MLENLFHVLRPTPSPSTGTLPDLDDVTVALDGVSPEALEALRHVAATAATVFGVRFACVVVANASHREVSVCVSEGAGHITNLPLELRSEVLDPSLATTVMRDPRGDTPWKKHRLANAFSSIEWNGDRIAARFGALAPLTIDQSPSFGALLLVDEVARSTWSDAQSTALSELAGLAALCLRALKPLPDTPQNAEPIPEKKPPQIDTEANHRTNEDLRDSELLFRSVVQTAGEAIVLSDAVGRIMAWNEGAERIFGFREENAIGHPLWAMLSRGVDGQRQELERLCGDLVRRAGGNSHNKRRDAPTAVFEAVARRGAGGEFPVEMALSAWQGEQSTYVSAFIRDVSTRHASESLRALSHAVSRILAEAPSLDEAAGGILRAIGENQAWGTGALWLIKRAPGVAGPVLRCVQTWTQTGVEVREMDMVRRQSSYACGVGLPGRVWAAGEPLWIEDISRDPHISRSSAIVRENMHTAMGFPIRFGHEILGVVDLYSLEGIASDTNFMEMAAGFGSQVGQFIARKQVEIEIRNRARQQAAVARLGQRALSRVGSEALLGEAVSLVTSTLAVDGCSILELMQGKGFRTRASAGGRAGIVGEIGIAADATTQAGWTLAAGQPVVVDDYHSETRFAVSPALEAAGAISGVSVVVGGGEEPFGVMLAHVAHERHFSTDDVHFLEAISNVIAASVERDAIESALQHARDEAERARAEAESAREDAEAARIEAERANHAKSAFLSHMSHELRTPLNAILGFVQLLNMDDLRPEQEECVHHIAQGGSHLLRLINEVLEISRIESGRLMLSIQPIAPGPLAREALNFIAPLAAHRSIELNFDEVSDWELEVNADPQRLHEILLNLLSNAVKYNREGGRIDLSCNVANGDMLCVYVHDTGPGIAPELLPRLFMPFERLGAESSAVEGTGLGLALTKSLVEAMGGTIQAVSEVGQGTVFNVCLPLSGRRTEAIERESGETQPPPDAFLQDRLDEYVGTVLYIEDNAANLLLVERLLDRSNNVKLISAVNGEDGFNMARAEQPDVILLDLHLPDISGAEVLQRLQREKATRLIPVIILTADATPGLNDKFLEEGAHDYLLKPLDIRALLDVLQATLPPVK